MGHRLSSRGLRLGAFGALLVLGVAAYACDDGDPPSTCDPPTGELPDFDAGLDCTFPCPVASPGDDAGGDTYASFASGFFATYCERCHDSSRTTNCFTAGNPTCRNGAPSSANWDDPASIRRHLDEIRSAVAVGDELYMPPDIPLTPDPAKPDPDCGERYRIARWIDSGAPGLP